MSVLILTEGISGGIAGPSRDRVLAFSYSWNERSFRALEVVRRGRRIGPASYRACELTEERFRALLDGVRDLGLAELPVEQPARSEDVYGRDIGLRFLHGDASFWNRCSGGCVSETSRVQPDGEQRRSFDDIVAFIERFAADLPMQAATALDGSVAAIASSSLAAEFPRVVAELAADPQFAGLDFDRVQEHGGLAFALREWRHLVEGRPETWPGYLQVWVAPGVPVQASFVNDRYRPSTAAERERREAFLAAHPELDDCTRDLIGAGWIEFGMTPEMVLAVLGEPERRDEVGGREVWRYDGSAVHRGDGHVSFEAGVVARGFTPPVLRP